MKTQETLLCQQTQAEAKTDIRDLSGKSDKCSKRLAKALSQLFMMINKDMITYENNLGWKIVTWHDYDNNIRG